MEVWIKIVSIVFLFGLILAPILLFYLIKKWNRLKHEFLIYFILGIIIMAGFIWAFAWWTHISDKLLLDHYGYDFDAINETSRLKEVPEENLDQVKSLEMGYLGIGWSLKAIVGYVFYFPYLLIVYLIGQLIR